MLIINISKIQLKIIFTTVLPAHLLEQTQESIKSVYSLVKNEAVVSIELSMLWSCFNIGLEHDKEYLNKTANVYCMSNGYEIYNEQNQMLKRHYISSF